MTSTAVQDARVAPGKGNDAAHVIQRAESVVKRLCGGCGRHFDARRRNQTYCRAACRWTAFQVRQRKSVATTPIAMISPAPDGDADDDRGVCWSRMGFE